MGGLRYLHVASTVRFQAVHNITRLRPQSVYSDPRQWFSFYVLWHGLYAQLRDLGIRQSCSIRLQCRLHLLLDELLDNLWTSPNECRRIEERGQLGKNGLKVSRVLDTFNQVVRLAFLLDDRTSLMRKHAGHMLVSTYSHHTSIALHGTYRISSCTSCLDLPFSTRAIMTFSVAMNGSSCSIRLAMTALFTTRPFEMLFSWPRKLASVQLGSSKLEASFTYQYQARVCTQERFRQSDATHSGVVQAALQPLWGVRLLSAGTVAPQSSAERA